MINNNKGAILLITVVSMMILTIIGYITLQMVSSQGVMDTYDQTKIRVDYAAEGMVERARGYIDYIVVKKSTPTSTVSAYGDVGFGANSGRGFLYSIVDGAVDNKWFLLENAEDDNQVMEGHVFDDSMYPYIYAGDIYCEFVKTPVDGFINGIDVHNNIFDLNLDPTANPKHQTFRIVAVASATVSAAGGSVIVSTAVYYFNVEHEVDMDANNIENHKTRNYSMGWRKQS